MSATVTDSPPMLTVSQAAHWLAVHETTIRRWIEDGSLPALRVGHSVRIDRDALSAWLAERKV